MEHFEFTVEEIPAKNRIDWYLCDLLANFTRSGLKRLIEEGNVRANGAPVKANEKLRIGDKIEVVVPESRKISLQPEDIAIEIVYEDDDIAVINKQQGLSVHPSETEPSGTLVNALLFRLKNLSGINGEIRPGIVHRIDKNTSGLLVVAKNDAAHVALSRQLEDKSCFRIYRAVVEGVVKEDSGTINAAISRSKTDRKKMAVDSGGRNAVTHFTVLERFSGNTYLEFRLETGRTHQIRVHCRHIGHPIVGDEVYGYSRQKFSLCGQLLHAYQLSFLHPRSGERVTFTAPLPDYFEKVLKTLKNTLQVR